MLVSVSTEGDTDTAVDSSLVWVARGSGLSFLIAAEVELEDYAIQSASSTNVATRLTVVL